MLRAGKCGFSIGLGSLREHAQQPKCVPPDEQGSRVPGFDGQSVPTQLKGMGWVSLVKNFFGLVKQGFDFFIGLQRYLPGLCS